MRRVSGGCGWSAMTPRSLRLPRVPVKLSFRLIFQAILLLLLLIWLLQSKLFAQYVAPPAPLVSRTAAELRPLDQLNQPPQITIAGKAARESAKKVKIPAKYDVSKIGQRRVAEGINFYSLDHEMAMGREMAQELEMHTKILHDPAITNYVNQIGQRLARNSDIRTPLIIKVIDSDEVNAFALPGGYFYVHSGLILAADNEAELAAVMAHEIAHVAARHATRNMTKMQMWNIASVPLIFFGGPVGMALRQVSSIAMPMSADKFSRDAEREADVLGIEYQYAAGYDPVAFVNFFERLKTKGKKSWVAKAFATHPMNEDRIRRAQKEIETMLPARQQYIIDTNDFEEAKAHLLETLEGKLRFGNHSQADGLVLRRSHDGGGEHGHDR